MSEHSPEPWGHYPCGKGEHVLYLPNTGKRVGPPKHLPNVIPDTIVARLFECSEKDAERIVACVNACAGIPTEALQKDGHRALLAHLPTVEALRGIILGQEEVNRNAMANLLACGYTVTPPSKLDLSDKISRAMPKDKP